MKLTYKTIKDLVWKKHANNSCSIIMKNYLDTRGDLEIFRHVMPLEEMDVQGIIEYDMFRKGWNTSYLHGRTYNHFPSHRIFKGC